MRFLLFISILFAGIPTFAAFSDHFSNGSVRIDFFRCGNSVHQDINIRRFCHEPFYAGSKTNLIDTFNYGAYRIEVFDAISNELIFSYGYASLFNEWITTDEAKKISKCFEESIRIPRPINEVNIVFYRRDRLLNWVEEFRLLLDPNDPYIEENHYPKFKVEEILNNKNDDETQIDLLFIPDGYTFDELNKFVMDVRNVFGYIAESDPMGKLRSKFNIRAVLSPSEANGTDFPGLKIWVNTVLNSTFYTFQTDRYLTSPSYHRIMDIAANAPADHVIILVNTDEYGGAGFYHFYTMIAAHNSETPFLFLHEFGHAFAGLADEYYSSDVAVEEFYALDVEPWEPNITTLVNFASKWQDMIPKNADIPSPLLDDMDTTLGVFEGAGYVAKRIYRPRMECTMKSVIYNYFCPVCQRAFVKAILWETE